MTAGDRDMPTIDEFWEVAAHIAGERGGLVVGFPAAGTQPELGSTLDKVLGFKPPQPPTVVRESDWADWQQQVEAFYRLRPSWGRGKPGDPNAKYYRVKFDRLDDAGFRSGRAPLPGPLFTDRLEVPSFGGYAAASTAFPGVSFWPRVLARAIDFVVHRVAGVVAGFTFAFMLTFASGGIRRFGQFAASHRLTFLFFAREFSAHFSIT
jgi:hypothetical protein